MKKPHHKDATFPHGDDCASHHHGDSELTYRCKRLQLALDMAQIAMFEYSAHDGTFYFDDRMYEFWGIRHGSPLNAHTLANAIHPDDQNLFNQALSETLGDQPQKRNPIHLRVINQKTHATRWLELNCRLFSDGGQQWIAGTAQDITRNMTIDQTPGSGNFLYKQLFLNLDASFALHEIICDQHGKPIDYKFLALNPAMLRSLGKTADQVLGKTALEIYPKTEQYWIDKFGEVALTGISTYYANYSSELGRYIEMQLFSPAKGQFAMLSTDITEKTLAHKKLSDTKDHFELLFNLYPDAVTITSLSNGLIKDFNNGYTKLTGYTREEALGKTIVELGIWENTDERDTFTGLLGKYGYCTDFESSFRHKNGNIFTGMVSAVVIQLKGEQHVLSVTRDISHRIEMEQELKKNAKALKESQRVAKLGSYRLDFATGLWTSSDVLDDIFGIAPSYPRNVVGWVQIIHPDWQDAMSQYLSEEIIIGGHEFNKEYKIINQSNGQEYWVHGLGELIYEDGKLKYMVGTIQDISLRKQAELLLQQKNQEQQELNDTQNKLFKIIAHDLRNPFNLLINCSELLCQSAINHEDDNVMELASNINAVSNQTYNLLENLLEWFRIQTGSLAPLYQTHNLKALADEVLTLSYELATKKKIVINNLIPDNITIECDREFTKTVLRNLISNAIKFTMPNGLISVKAIKHDYCLEIKVKDTGVGIHPDIIDHLFTIDPNITAYGTDNEKGSGLGLALCKDLVEMQGGKIWADSRLDKGSTMSFTIPYKQE